MKKNHLFLLLFLTLLFTGCQSFHHHRQYAGRQYVKTEPGIAAQKNNPEPGIVTPVVTGKTGIQTPVQQQVKDEKKNSSASYPIRKHTPEKKHTIVQKPVHGKQSLPGIKKTTGGGGLNILSLVFSGIGFVLFIIMIILVAAASGFGAGYVALFLGIPAFVFGAIGLGLGIGGVASGASLKGVGIAGIIAGGIVFAVILTFLLIILL